MHLELTKWYLNCTRRIKNRVYKANIILCWHRLQKQLFQTLNGVVLLQECKLSIKFIWDHHGGVVKHIQPKKNP